MMVGDVGRQDVFHVQEQRLRCEQREEASKQHFVAVEAKIRGSRRVVFFVQRLRDTSSLGASPKSRMHQRFDLPALRFMASQGWYLERLLLCVDGGASSQVNLAGLRA